MRIGILSIYLHSNYGGILQAYALQTILNRLGHKVYIINGGVYSNNSIIKDLFKSVRWICQEIKKRRIPSIKNCSVFNHHKLSKFVYANLCIMNNNAICDIKQMKFDAIIVGSDQVWRKYGHIKDISYFYLGFTNDWNIKRLSYAASFGANEWEYNKEETDKCRALLKKYEGVSVREFEGRELCKEYLDCDAKVVVDPTMLLTKKDYLNVCKNSRGISTKFLVYILDYTQDKKNAINYLEQITGETASKNDSLNLLGQKNSVESWIKSFNNADFIFTDSFHGCVFSIIFNKPFIVYANSERGLSRFNTLLKHFGLQNRMVFCSKDVIDVYSSDINWQNVNEKMIFLRSEAISFLTEYLLK